MLRSNQEGNFCKEYVLHRFSMFDGSSRSFSGQANNLGASPMTVGTVTHTGLLPALSQNPGIRFVARDRPGMDKGVVEQPGAGMGTASMRADTYPSLNLPL